MSGEEGASSDAGGAWTMLFVDLTEDDEFKGVNVRFERRVSARRAGDMIEFGHVWETSSYVMPPPATTILFALPRAAALALDAADLPDGEVATGLIARRDAIAPLIEALLD